MCDGGSRSWALQSSEAELEEGRGDHGCVLSGASLPITYFTISGRNLIACDGAFYERVLQHGSSLHHSISHHSVSSSILTAPPPGVQISTWSTEFTPYKEQVWSIPHRAVGGLFNR